MPRGSVADLGLITNRKDLRDTAYGARPSSGTGRPTGNGVLRRGRDAQGTFEVGVAGAR
jgi:hypothetical protein